MTHAMAGNLYKAAFFIRFTSVSPEIETLLQGLTATTALAEAAHLRGRLEAFDVNLPKATAGPARSFGKRAPDGKKAPGDHIG